MGKPPGGPLSGGMEAQQAWANETIRENAAQRQQPAQEAERPQETPAPSQADLTAAAIQRNLEQNERVAERNARERALTEAAQALAPKENPNLDQQQLEQQRQRDGDEREI